MNYLNHPFFSDEIIFSFSVFVLLLAFLKAKLASITVTIDMKKMGMQAVDFAIQNGVDLDGTPIPQKMLDLYNRSMDEENKRQRSGVKKSMRNRCVKTGSKHFDKEKLNQLLIDSGWEGLKEKEILFFYS